MADKPAKSDNMEKIQTMFANVGIRLDPATDQQVKKALNPIQKYMSDFNKTTDMKNTFFGKLPGIKTMLSNLKPDTIRFTEQMVTMGRASQMGADDNKEFYNSLGIMGKILVNTLGRVESFAAGFGLLGKAITGVLSFGIGLLIDGLLLVAQGFKNIIMAAIDWQDVLNDFSKMMGGVGHDRMMVFNAGVNTNLKSLQEYGFALGDFMGSFKAYIAGGLNPAIATNVALTKTTLQLASVTGESAAEIAGFWTSIYKGSKLSIGSFKDMGDSFTTFNKIAEKSGIIGTISFGQFKEAVTSSGTALLIAAAKGHQATQRLTADLAGLAGLANALGISVTEMNAKFEEAGNLISAPDSPFRALLAISGGAGIGNMMNNSFDRTTAMLKVSDQLTKLSAQFGGNLNIMSQVAESAFGISKEMAIKFATMSAAQKNALQLARKDAEYMKAGGLEKSWENVSTTITTVFDRFKNTIYTMFQRAFVGGAGVNGILTHISEKLGGMLRDLSRPGSPISKLVDKLGGVINGAFEWLGKWLDNIDPLFDKLKNWIDDVVTVFSGEGGFLKGIGKVLGDIFFDALIPVLKVGGIILKDSIIAAVWALRNKDPNKLFHDDYKDPSKGMDYTTHIGNVVKNGLGQSLDDNTQAINKNNLIVADANKKLAFSNEMAEKEQEKARYNGFKDTDLVVNKLGAFSLAGIERNKLDNEEASIQVQQRDYLKQIKESNDIIADKAAKDKEKEAKDKTEAPPPPKPEAPWSFVGFAGRNLVH